jgi:hypothetical protein
VGDPGRVGEAGLRAYDQISAVPHIATNMHKPHGVVIALAACTLALGIGGLVLSRADPDDRSPVTSGAQGLGATPHLPPATPKTAGAPGRVSTDDGGE